MGTALAILGIIVGLISIIVTYILSDPKSVRVRRILSKINRTQPEVPELESAGKEARQNYVSLMSDYVRSQKAYIAELDFPYDKDIFGPSIQLRGVCVDCICSVLSQKKGSIFLFLPSGDSSPTIEGVGRTALITRLLNIRLPYTKLIGLNKIDFDELDKLELNFEHPRAWSLISSDMAFISVVDKHICAVPTKGERVNFICDLARHLFRATDLTYSSGSHRYFPKRDQLIKLFNMLSCRGLDNLYVSPKIHQIDEILIIKRECSAKIEAPIIKKINYPSSFKVLEDSLLISSDAHGSNYWRRSKAKLKFSIRYMIDRIGNPKSLSVRELSIKVPNGNVPSFIYDDAIRLLNNTSLSRDDEFQDISELNRFGNLFVGISNFNKVLFSLISLVPNIKMLITSGEKVFQDAAFWRHLLNIKRPFLLEVLMLDPNSEFVDELEKTTYSDKPKGFIRQEIENNIEVISNVSNRLRQDKSAVEVKSFLYKNRPEYRITIIGDERLIISHYLYKTRTGEKTLFIDLYGAQTKKFVESIYKIYENVKASSNQVV